MNLKRGGNPNLKRFYSFLIAGLLFGLITIPILFSIDTAAESEITYWEGYPINELRYYPGSLDNDSSNVFWFVHITDVHINAFQAVFEEQSEVFRRTLYDIENYINPFFIVDSGDMVNGLNPLPFTQVPEQWKTRWDIIKEFNLNNDSYYYDVVGNHDAYGDSVNFSYFLNWSVQKKLQYNFTAPVSFGQYHFIALNSAWDDGSEWPDGTNAELDTEELDWFESQLENITGTSNLTFIVSHHQSWDIAAGGEKSTSGYTFLDLLEKYNVSAHFFGHGHEDVQRNQGGTLYIETGSLGQGDESYRIFAVDNDGISEKKVILETWPVAMITSPMDRDLIRTAYDIPNNTKSAPVRALVFDTMPIDSVQFRIDMGIWQNMTNSSSIEPLWNGSFDAIGLSEGVHTITLRAESQSGVSTDSISFYIGSPDKPEIINGDLKDVVRYSDSDPLYYDLSMYKWDKKDTNSQLYWNITGIDSNFCGVEIVNSDILVFDPVPRATGTQTINISLTNSDNKSTSQEISITLYSRISTNNLIFIIGIIELIILLATITVGIFYPKINDFLKIGEKPD
jgi:predicted MPP superfamily phosphohydrolase